MREAILERAPQMDAVIMAAAVGDYRPLQVAPQKIKKLQDEENITLVRNSDILGYLGKSRSTSRRPILVGFAAETENLIENATKKLVQKNLDFIVANNLTQLGSGFGCDTNQVKIVDREGNISDLPPMTKEEVAEQVFDRIEQLLSITEP